MKQRIDDDALEFFNGLSGTLQIELTEPAQKAAPHLLNLVAPKNAHHIFFEGIELEEDVWTICWGS